MKAVPWSLVALRLLLAPVMVLLAHSSCRGSMLALVLLVALLSDIFDGIIARRLQCDTAAIRLADSLVDTAFYLAVLGALWLRLPSAVLRYLPLLGLLLCLEAVRHVYDLRKFGKSASYHSYLAKLWGFVMAVSVMVVFTWNTHEWLLALSMALGILNNIEGLIMSAILPVWTRDVKTLRQALALRN